MTNLNFICPLPNGLHARPAKEIELRANRFNCDILLVNSSKDKTANAKSVLSMISADILEGDHCQFIFTGSDANEALMFFQAFVDTELSHIDNAIDTQNVQLSEQPLPVGLMRAAPRYVRGTVASVGLGEASATLWQQTDLRKMAAALPSQTSSCIESELQSALKALQLNLLKKQPSSEGECKEILEAHLKIAQDEELGRALMMQNNALNTLDAIANACDKLCAPLENSASDYLKERALDIKDIALQLANIVRDEDLSQMPTITAPTILVSDTLLTPSQLLALPKALIQGIVMGEGGSTSHTIILARSFNIPVLVGIENLTQQIIQGQRLVVDAINGALILESNVACDAFYQLERKKLNALSAQTAEFKDLKVTTLDKEKVNVLANIVSSEEAEGIYSSGADGIGLYRTEMLFCERTTPPSEEEQFQHYSNVVKHSQGNKVVIRTLDIGGDKPCAYMGFPAEDNPFLGYRAVRMYPQYDAIIRSQLRALLRASCFGEVSIMVPMISNLNEIIWCRELIDELAIELANEGHELGNIRLGAMAEVPSIAYIFDQASEFIDFISIGSNDLAQYFFACDRGNKTIADLYDHLNPAFIAFLKQLIGSAKVAKLEVSLCGEFAADPIAQPLLLGCGLTQFSMAASKIATSKRALTRLNVNECEALVNEVLTLTNSEQVKARVAAFYNSSDGKETLDEALVFTQQSIRSKEEAIKLLCDNLEINERTGCANEVEKAIWDREAVFSTALGFSVAIPHCKSSSVSHNSVSVLTIDNPISWGEDVDVDIIIMLTVTEEGKDSHMKIFSKIARKLMHEDFRTSLQQAHERKQIIDILNNAINA